MKKTEASNMTGWAKGICTDRGFGARTHRVCSALLTTMALVFMISLGICKEASGQVTTADIVGIVTDTSGAILPGASVTVTNLGTKIKRILTADSTGGFTVTLLDPGTYSVSVAMTGFKTAQIVSLALAAGDRSRVDTSLQVGGADQTVEVTASTPALQSDNSTLTRALTEQAVQDLPLNGRNIINLAQILPGANEGPPNGLSSGARPDDRRPTSSISVNGQSDILNNQLIDGMDNNERLIGTVGVRPSIDAIAELRIQTNAYTAEVGRTGGGVVNVITRQGTSAFHGTAYEFVRNDKLNAFPFAFGVAIPKPKLRQNQFGGSIGGPVYKNKTFFFTDYEALRVRSAVNPIQSIVPTLYEEQHIGDFSDVGGPVLTAAQLDPVGVDYFKLYPAPNGLSSTGAPTYTSAPIKNQNSSTVDARIDHHFSANDIVFARYTYNNFNTYLGGRFPNATVAGLSIAPGGDAAAFFGTGSNIAHSSQLNYIHIFSPTIILEVKAGYSLINNQSTPLNSGLDVNTAFGQPNVNLDSFTSGLAPVAVTAATALGEAGAFDPLQELDNTFQYMGAITINRGKHSVKMGAGIVRRQITLHQNNSGLGTWTVTNLPNLEQGIFSSLSRNIALIVPHLRSWEPSFYVQDDWRFTPKLTLNVGLRYDIYTPYTDAAGKLANFDIYNGGNILVAGQNGVSTLRASPRITLAFNRVLDLHTLLIRLL